METNNGKITPGIYIPGFKKLVLVRGINCQRLDFSPEDRLCSSGSEFSIEACQKLPPLLPVNKSGKARCFDVSEFDLPSSC